MRERVRWGVAAIAAVYLTLSLASAWTILPWSDEAWFSSPALSLVTKGQMGTLVLDPTADFRTNHVVGIDRYTYWITPLYPLTQAFWHRIFGFSLRSVRLYSVFWGLVALWASFLTMRMLSGDHRVAWLAAALLSLDFTFIRAASVGRMDMMCAALGLSGFALFLALRERSLSLAVLISQTCVVASGLSHPNGRGYFIGLAFLTIALDRRRIRPSHVAIGLIPYAVGAMAWGAYVLQAPSIFYAQFFGNGADRFIALSRPLETLHQQFVARFLYEYGFAPDTQGASHVKIIVLLAYVLGLVGVVAARDIRRHPGYRLLILLSTLCFLTFMAMDRQTQFHYLVHYVLFLVFLLAVWGVWCWDRRVLPRSVQLTGWAVLIVVQLTVIASRTAPNPYRNMYLTTTEFIDRHAAKTDLIMGSAELAFELGFDGRVVDDHRLGFRSGKRPDVIVIDHNRYEEWIPLLQEQDPPAYRYIRGLMQQFDLIYENRAYKVYARTGASI